MIYIVFFLGHYLVYHLYAGLMWDYKSDLSHNFIAFRGDWLIEHKDGCWQIMSNEEYKGKILNLK